MRWTFVTPENLNRSLTFRMHMDFMWLLIENSYEENWRVEANGDVTLEVDEAMLTRVLSDNPEVALDAFGAYEEHNPEHEKWEWINVPEHLLGTYTIKGIYTPGQIYVDGEREYYFTQEGF